MDGGRGKRPPDRVEQRLVPAPRATDHSGWFGDGRTGRRLHPGPGHDEHDREARAMPAAATAPAATTWSVACCAAGRGLLADRRFHPSRLLAARFVGRPDVHCRSAELPGVVMVLRPARTPAPVPARGDPGPRLPRDVACLESAQPAAKSRSITRRLATASSGGVGSGPPSRTAAAKRSASTRVGIGRLEGQRLGRRRDGRVAAGRHVDLRRPVGRDVERDVDRDPAARSRRRGPAGRAPAGSSR